MTNNERFENIERRLKVLEKALLTPVKQSTGKKLAIKEFMLKLNFSSHVDILLAVAYYLEKYDECETINSDDLASGYRNAKIPAVQNVNDKVNQNIRKGLMMEIDEKKDGKKAWVLTASGEEFIEKCFVD